MNLRSRRVAGPLSLIVSLAVVIALGLVAGGTSASSSASTAARTADRTVAHTGQGSLDSKIRGTTANGRKVTGTFVPLTFTRRPGRVKVRGLLQGVVHNANGSTRTFAVMRTMRVKKINGEPVRLANARQAQRVQCDVLNLVLGPLDLDLLGLQVHLNRVVLDIVAQSGAGNLLGNLLCAVAGILDGGLLGSALRRLTRVLNRVLGQLGLGL